MATIPRAPWWRLDPAETLRVRFVESLQGLGTAEWEVVARKYEASEEALHAQRQRLVKLNSTCADIAFAAPDKEREQALALIRWEHAMLQRVNDALPEFVDGGRFPLRRWALAAGRTAQTVLRFTDERVKAKDKRKLLGLGLGAFTGHASIPALAVAPTEEASAPVLPIPRAPSHGSVDTGVFHLLFTPEYLRSGANVYGPGERQFHESWRLQPASLPAARVGGTTSGRCAVCGEKLHRLLDLPSISTLPAGAGSGLEIVSCLSCLGWSAPFLHFRHDPNREPAPIGYDGPRKVPEFPATGLCAGKVNLATTPKRWWRQPRGDADGQNLHRIGGTPSWVQDSETVRCPDCGRRMKFLLQLDSGLPLVNGERWLWGSGGLLYVFWCGACRIDTQFWQCT